jgi:signal transduction histidine kinase
VADPPPAPGDYGDPVERVKRLMARVKTLDGMVLDTVLAIGAAVLVTISVFAGETPEQFEEPTALAAVLSVVIAVPLLWRRTHPLAALIASSAVIVTELALDYPDGAMSIVLLVLTYGVGVWCDTRRAVIGYAFIVATIAGLAIADTPGLDAGTTLANFAFFTCAWVVGLVVRSRRAESAARLAEAEERAEVQRQEGARAVAEERLRIAQELHDVVAHSMSVIAVQAGVGAHVLDSQPEEARRSLEAISQTSRATLAEMRRLLGVLRGEDGERSHAPAPGLDDLDALVTEVRVTGVDVSLELVGDRTPVPPGVDLSAYRVVQEALTNVIKHAGEGVTARVTVGCSVDELCIEVLDDGRGASVAAAPGGHGLVGMRERVAVWGGELTTGPRPGGGYRVRARIPLGCAE